MKIVFNFKTLLIAAALVALPGSARAESVYYTPRELLADFFRSSQNVTYRKFTLTPAERQRLQQRLGYAPSRGTYTFFVATSGDKVDGYALFDEELGEHLPISFAVKIAPNGTIERQEVCVYRESRGDEVRDERFRRQFVGKTPNDALSINSDIVAISGATISSRSMSVGVKRALVLFEELVKSRIVTAGNQPVSPQKRPGTL